MEDSKVTWNNEDELEEEEEEALLKRNFCLVCMRRFVDVKQTLTYESKILSRTEKKSANRDLLAQHQRSELVIRHAHWVLKALRKNSCVGEKGQIQELAEKSKVKDMLKPSTTQLQREVSQAKNKKRRLSYANNNIRSIEYPSALGEEYPKQEHAVADGDRMLVNHAAAAQQNPSLILQ